MGLDRPQAQDPYAKLPQVASFTVTSVDDEASAAVVSFNLVFHTPVRAQLVATFQR